MLSGKILEGSYLLALQVLCWACWKAACSSFQAATLLH